MKNKTTKVLGIMVGIGIICLGTTLLSVDLSTIGKSISFGADFYTEIYDVTQDVGRAVNQMIRSIHKCSGWGLITIGAITTINYLDKLVDSFSAEKADKPEENNHDNDANELPDL